MISELFAKVAGKQNFDFEPIKIEAPKILSKATSQSSTDQSSSITTDSNLNHNSLDTITPSNSSRASFTNLPRLVLTSISHSSESISQNKTTQHHNSSETC
jgi:hypothetical protein